MFLGQSAKFGENNFLGKLVSRLSTQGTTNIRPITETSVEQVLVFEMTREDLETLRFSAEEGETNRKDKWDALLRRLVLGLKEDFELPEDPIINVILEPDLVTIEILRPSFSAQKHLLVLP